MVEAPTPEDANHKEKELVVQDMDALIISYRKSETETIPKADGTTEPVLYPQFAYINPNTGNTVIETPIEQVHQLFGRHIEWSRCMLTENALKRLFRLTMVPEPTEPASQAPT